jgi:type II secretory pathway pseudopilin PulG
MSQPPLPYQSTSIRSAAPNILAIVGFVFVVLGLAGFCMPLAFLSGAIGAVLCGVALFRRPRGLAIAGLVVGLLEVIAGLIILAVVGIYYGSKARTAIQDAQLHDSARHAMVISFAIDAYKRDHGSLPPNLGVLSLGKDALDGFGNPIRYAPSPETGTYQLFSNGWDGKPNTKDDFILADTSIKQISTTVIPTIPRTPPSPFERETRQQAIKSYDAMLEGLDMSIDELEKTTGPSVDRERLIEMKTRRDGIRAERDRLAAANAATTQSVKP